VKLEGSTRYSIYNSEHDLILSYLKHEVSENGFCIGPETGTRYIGCNMVSTTDPYGRILDFLDRSCYFSFKQLLNCIHEAEWTPFHTSYFSENVVTPGIEAGPMCL
jgi:hypothetical protein